MVEAEDEASIARGSCNHLRIPDHVQQRDNVWSSGQVLKDLDLALDLLLLDGLQNLDDTLLVVDDVDALKDLAVLSTACMFGTLLADHPAFVCRVRGDEPILRTTS